MTISAETFAKNLQTDCDYLYIGIKQKNKKTKKLSCMQKSYQYNDHSNKKNQHWNRIILHKSFYSCLYVHLFNFLQTLWFVNPLRAISTIIHIAEVNISELVKEKQVLQYHTMRRKSYKNARKGISSFIMYTSHERYWIKYDADNNSWQLWLYHTSG